MNITTRPIIDGFHARFEQMERGERVGGATVLYGGERRICTIETFQINPPHQRKGFGTKLFRSVSEWLKEKDCECLTGLAIHPAMVQWAAQAGGTIRDVQGQIISEDAAALDRFGFFSIPLKEGGCEPKHSSTE